MTDPRRTAAALRVHAIAPTAAIVAAFVAVLVAPTVWIADPHHPSTQYGVHMTHFSVSTPLWLVAAYQLVMLRRHAQVARLALAIGAIAAVVVAVASIGAELATHVPRTFPPDERWIIVSVWTALAAMVAWVIATCVACAKLAARLAAGTLHLPDARRRRRALGLRATWFAMIPATAVMAFIAGASTGVLGVLVVLAGELVAMSIAQLLLAQLVAQSRTLATASIRE